MTIKSILFILFLCLCLIWAVAVYQYVGPEVFNHGLLWTILLLSAVLILMIGSRLWGWWRLWRVKGAQHPVISAQPAPAVHEDDAALAALIGEANAALAKAPGYKASTGKSPLSHFPLYLLVGPAGSGKTATFLNSGVEPQMLAGQPGTSPTRLCNLWLANNAVFAEVSGRAFAGDGERWRAQLRVLGGTPALSFWQRLWHAPEPGLRLRGVVGFCDVRELTGAAADPQRFERSCRDWQDRLRAISQVFGSDFPVYQVFTKSDKIPFFPEYFGRLPESEVNQILGCTLPFRRPNASPATEVFADAEAKRLTGAFRPLYQSLAERRLSHLAHEPNQARKPGIYEFPREMKRVRQPLVQFLMDVFRPNQLQSVPVLRGFYFTGVQEVEAAVAKTTPEDGEWTNSNLSLEATRLFRGGDATQIFRQSDTEHASAARGRAATKTRWIFASDLFHQIVLTDRPPLQTAAPPDPRFERYRSGVVGATCAASILLCLAFVTSWANNRSLLNDVAEAGGALAKKQASLASVRDLQALDNLREQVERLQNGAGLSYRWGLYTGNDIRDNATRTYFARFQQLLLIDLDDVMLDRLRNLSVTPAATDPYEPAYGYLKTHLMIASGSCKPDPSFVSRTLKQARDQLSQDASPEWQALASRQIDFYAKELAHGNPSPLKEDSQARDRARHYLEGIKGIEPIYRNILTDAERTLQKPQQLEDLAPNYKTVLASKAEISPAFSQQGWSYVEEASKKTRSGAGAEPCVLGRGPSLAALTSDDSAAIQGRFISEYMKHWRDYVAGFSVLPYSNAADAARKLGILADHKSPLLALFALAANQTNFAAPMQSGVVAKVKVGLRELIDQGKKKSEQVTGAQQDAPHQPSVSDITQMFQPVEWVVPPNSPTWVVEKNAAYVSALSQLGQAMQAIATSDTPDAAVYQGAIGNFDKAMEAAKQIESGFKPVNVQGLDGEVQRLLEEPIRRTTHLIQVDPTQGVANKINKALAELCGHLKGTLRKYPFQAKSQEDTTLAELMAFSPAGGAIWQFAAGPLAEFAVKDGTVWKSKDPAKKPQVTPELLTFLGRAQTIASGFFAASPSQPGFTYIVRPNLSPDFGDAKLQLELDGKSYLWENPLQKTLPWPGEPGGEWKAVARISGGKVAHQFDTHKGLWGIFRIMADAEPRPLLGKTVEWRYSIGPEGSKDPITPGPVRMVVVQFPGGTDVFNPLLYQGLTCPGKAVQ